MRKRRLLVLLGGLLVVAVVLFVSCGGESLPLAQAEPTEQERAIYREGKRFLREHGADYPEWRKTHETTVRDLEERSPQLRNDP